MKTSNNTTQLEFNNPIFSKITINPKSQSGYVTELIDPETREAVHSSIRRNYVWYDTDPNRITIKSKNGDIEVTTKNARVISIEASLHLYPEFKSAELNTWYETTGSDGKTYYFNQVKSESTHPDHYNYRPRTWICSVYRKKAH